MPSVRSRARSTVVDLFCAPDHDERIAVRTDDRQVTRRELRGLVDAQRSALDLGPRSVVVLRGDASLEWVVAYLALLADRHVPLLAGDHADRLIDAWSPAAVISAGPGGVDVDRRPEAVAADLHPDLALLLSTSGSTGDPKLVRLSHENLTSNARAIGNALGLRPDDVGITTLPLHYCFGLSVVHSHLAAGASVAMSGASVVDPCFLDQVQRHGVTNIAGVPHTYELLEHAGPERMHLPSLRLLAQAGGKLAPPAVARWRDRARSWGAEFVVMYGQTEATARMAYLPPALADRHPEAIGLPIPGGSFRLAATDQEASTDEAVGELVYEGPNVMLGYARRPTDLALGRTIDELHTGDLARYHPDSGVYEIVGRRSRFIKPFGLRIDVDALQRDLVEFLESTDVAVAGDDDGVAVVAPGCDPRALRDEVQHRTGLPAGSVAVDTDSPIPRTESSKPDHAAVTRLARAASAAAAAAADGVSAASPTDGAANIKADTDTDTDTDTVAVARIYGAVLGRTAVSANDTFVGLGGDSLSYVECSFRLESLLGRLPADWHVRPIRELVPRRRSRWFVPLDTTALLRVAGILAIVATHMRLHFFPGGAHLMLAVVGYNLSRFLLPIESARARLAAGMRTTARVAVPTVIWVAAGLIVGASFGLGTLFLINNYTGPASHRGDHWHFWFIEVFVHVTAAVTLLTLIPPLRRFERRRPYTAALGVLGVCLLLRMEWAWLGDWYNLRYRTHGVAWFVALGWLVHRSDTRLQRVATAAIIVATVPGFFHNGQREWFIAGALLLLLAAREIPVPRLAARPLVALGAASMWIYITHFTFWPPLVEAMGVRAAYVPTIALGVAVWALIEHGPRVMSTLPHPRLMVLRRVPLGFRTRG